MAEVQDEERLIVHHIRLGKVREEPVHDAVREDADLGWRSSEVPRDLSKVAVKQLNIRLFTLDQHRWHAVVHEHVIDLLALQSSDIGDVLRDDLGGVEHVVAERRDERQHQRVLGGLLGLQTALEAGKPLGECRELIVKFHWSAFLPRD